MPQKTESVNTYHLMLAAAGFVIVVAGLRAAASIIVPFLLALFLAILCGPPLTWLNRRGVPRSLAMVIVLAGVLTLGLGFATIVGGMANRLASEWPTTFEPRAVALAEQWNQSLERQRIERPWLSRFQVADLQGWWAKLLRSERLMGYVTSAMRTVTGTLSNVFFVLITTVFMLTEIALLPDKLRAISPDAKRWLTNLDRIAEDINRYMGIKTWTSLLTGTIVTLGLWLVGVEFALLWGLAAFLLNFVPNIGSILAAVPAVIWTLLQLGYGPAFTVILLYLMVNTLIGNFLEPRWMGRGLGLSTLFVFLSLVFWGWVLGAVGMVISVPLTMTIKIALESHPDTRWLAVMMGGVPSEEPPRTDVA